ncbi:hypothetical protein HYH03_007192 [Edaphochlamys debaryana]|uniref:SCP domain-containing protein n=1 Tax=Edaphochlamys debaryana TaxID=47281 RepID=A0A835Y5S2_9CHLO|nr:hypothetical protein HYH03_007192 [Edaphochlamys debaryana]|eukprot:KAG2494676.1 hypothetical protein HYH03_007192 [Edaphochlamys debaryana]
MTSVLSYHNTVRKAHGNVNLTINATLTANAVDWAKYLINVTGCAGLTHSVLVGRYGAGWYGENLGMDLANKNYSCLTATRAWYEPELTNYDWRNPGQPIVPWNANNLPVLHMTQMLWNSSVQIGCGLAVGSLDSSMNCSVVVCHYARQGNVAGRYTTEVPPRKDSCAKPATFCTGAGASLVQTDCDGDGKYDWVCMEPLGRYRGTVLSSKNCTAVWPNALIESCPSSFGCLKPGNFCTNANSTLRYTDCDGDRRLDWTCRPPPGSGQYETSIMSSSGCKVAPFARLDSNCPAAWADCPQPDPYAIGCEGWMCSYRKIDCDGDGRLDWVVTDSVGRRGIVLSKQWCSLWPAVTGWPNASTNLCRPAFTPLNCSGIGGYRVYSNRDHAGDDLQEFRPLSVNGSYGPTRNAMINACNTNPFCRGFSFITGWGMLKTVANATGNSTGMCLYEKIQPMSNPLVNRTLYIAINTSLTNCVGVNPPVGFIGTGAPPAGSTTPSITEADLLRLPVDFKPTQGACGWGTNVLQRVYMGKPGNATVADWFLRAGGPGGPCWSLRGFSTTNQTLVLKACGSPLPSDQRFRILRTVGSFFNIRPTLNQTLCMNVESNSSSVSLNRGFVFRPCSAAIRAQGFVFEP